MTAKFEPGQPVVVSEHGRSYDGEIVSVGRSLLEITYGGRSRIVKFRQDTQRATDPQIGSGTYFQTLEEVAARDREIAARIILSDCGIELSPRRKFTVEQMEALARVAQTFTEEED